jgi:hypothetical protein
VRRRAHAKILEKKKIFGFIVAGPCVGPAGSEWDKAHRASVVVLLAAEHTLDMYKQRRKLKRRRIDMQRPGMADLDINVGPPAPHFPM